MVLKGLFILCLEYSSPSYIGLVTTNTAESALGKLQLYMIHGSQFMASVSMLGCYDTHVGT